MRSRVRLEVPRDRVGESAVRNSGAGLDYHDMACVTVHPDWEAVQASGIEHGAH